MAFSLLVVRIMGTETWGGFVYYFLWASLASFVMNWGNRDYLLREFAKQPANIPHLWRESFFTRAMLFIPCTAVFLVSFSFSETIMLSAWTILLFVSQSFDIFTVYYRKFKHAFLIEIISGIFLAAFVVLRTGFEIFTFYLLYLCIRMFLYIILFRKDVFKNFDIRIKFSLLKKSILFFMLGLTGLIGSRVDQYCVSLMLPKEELGKYNILKSILLYFQAVSGFIILPFVKDIYRMGEKSIRKLDNRLFIIGLLLTPFYIFTLYILMKFFYGFSFSADIYIYGALFIPAVYYYSVKVYKMIKEEKISTVILITVITMSAAAVMNIVLIPSLQIKGSMIASVVSGIISLILYFIFNRKYRTA